ncbi:hypothetical protein DDB_G0272602 [Dictyostelium discoideum AX4]|uniref:RING-type domain-containing protein n=1 Tax=Dictyostelium discoideum TaxID=44689 RepID=Q556P0_DICDI|nr:hypothetical protein DDB_G0273947 [Dictyostelium discoideum AX4]XP_645082.1 hypothetical protein DDB_G0272602 [Dictyostelium discoideum AX4]EAL70407.1 hypothetical protein DDB_G0273947 [Dictyostelium discoideum AX4]EAL70938.1 hypothetical protein DDB_G0272602 [Dictyostelium discoideum AX4]|eukprot:XP_644332.1 hypothetical protein DDB_G0273947 [Dictyostelium discoideum AX4]
MAINYEINGNEIKNLQTITYNYKEPIEIDKELECMICLLPLLEPVVEPNCRQMFCKDCLTNWSIEKGQKGCPYCQQSFNIKSVSLPPKFVTNTLDSLLVYCNTDGCEFNSNSDRNQLIRRCEYRNHFERICKVICIDCNQQFTREQLKLHSNECTSKSVKCNASSLMCSWVGPIKELQSHESNCHYIALSPILNKLYDKIQQLDISNQKTTSFLLEKINYLESIISSSSALSTPNLSSPIYYQPIPTAPLPDSTTMYDNRNTTTTTTTTTTISLDKITPVEIKKVASIEIFKNNSNKYVIGKVESGVKSVSIDGDYADTWPIVKGNLPNSVDTLILLDGFKELVYSVPKSIKVLHIGDIKKSHAFYIQCSSVNEIHFHDNCKIKFTKNVIPDSAKTVHFYRINEPLTTESIGKNVKCLHIHDGFSKSLGYGVLPSSIQELHLYDIKRQALSIPSSIKILYLHNQFNNESIELPDQLETLYLDNIIHPIKNFPSSLKTIHLINYKFEDKVPFPPKVKIIMGTK